MRTSFAATPARATASSTAFIRAVTSAVAAPTVLAVDSTPTVNDAESGATETLPSPETAMVRGGRGGGMPGTGGGARREASWASALPAQAASARTHRGDERAPGHDQAFAFGGGSRRRRPARPAPG